MIEKLIVHWFKGNGFQQGKSAMPPLFNHPEVFSSASNEAKYFAENFSRNSDLYDPGISLPVFLSKNNLKLHNILVTPPVG